MILQFKSNRGAALLLSCCGLLSGCSAQPAAVTPLVEQHVPVIVVTSYPLYAMATEVGGDAVAVQWIGSDAESPPKWIPSGEDIRRLQVADLILLNGAGYEPWTQNLSLPRSRTIDTTTAASGLAGYADQLLSIDGKVTHRHGPQGSQSVGTIAAMTWLDPALAITQLDRVELELARMLPDQCEQISERATSMRQRLVQIDERLKALNLRTETLLADSSDVAYLVSALKSELRVLDSAAEDPASDFAEAIQAFEPSLLVFRKNAPAVVQRLFVESLVPAVAIDLCDQVHGEKSFVERLNGNIDRLEAGIDDDLK